MAGASREKPFSRKNRVLIVKGDYINCNGFSTVYSVDAYAPYYGTDVAIDSDLNFLFFDLDKIHTNKKIDSCFDDRQGKYIYPKLTGNGVLYAKMNGNRYGIRDFDNSIFFCKWK